MENFNRKEHWETIYQTKKLTEVSWYQPKPSTSLGFFELFEVATNAKIIDIGGGDSFLVDNLLDLGYTDLTVLDISATALERAKQRLGDRAKQVKWIVADVADFKPTEKYNFWHDRAAFHFLVAEQDIEQYINTVTQCIEPQGILVVGTFSEQGPKKCSGINIQQYSEEALCNKFKLSFDKVKCASVEHKTPFDTTQSFTFCSFKRNNSVT